MQPSLLRTAVHSKESVLANNSVLRNTYMLLSLTLIFSALVAYYTVISNARSPGIIITLVGVYGLMFLTQALRNSPWGLLSIFAFTGFMGYTIGPLINAILTGFSNGGQLVMTAMGATGIIFLSLSAYVTTTRKSFTYLGGFLFGAIIIAFVASIAGFLFNIPMLQLVVSGAFALIASGMILYQTSMIIEGGERNYIMATIGLFVALYNLFISLLQILSFFAGNRD